MLHTAIVEYWVQQKKRTTLSLEKIVIGVYDTLAEACKARLDYEAKNKPNFFKAEGRY